MLLLLFSEVFWSKSLFLRFPSREKSLSCQQHEDEVLVEGLPLESKVELWFLDSTEGKAVICSWASRRICKSRILLLFQCPKTLEDTAMQIMNIWISFTLALLALFFFAKF